MKKYFVALAGLLATTMVSAVLAHATVKSDMGLSESKAGSYETYRLQVPTEKPLDTTEVKLFVPQGLTISTFQALAGFDRSVEKMRTASLQLSPGRARSGSKNFNAFCLAPKTQPNRPHCFLRSTKPTVMAASSNGRTKTPRAKRPPRGLKSSK